MIAVMRPLSPRRRHNANTAATGTAAAEMAAKGRITALCDHHTHTNTVPFNENTPLHKVTHSLTDELGTSVVQRLVCVGVRTQ